MDLNDLNAQTNTETREYWEHENDRVFNFLRPTPRPRHKKPDFFKKSYFNDRLLYELASALMHVIAC